MAQRMLLNQPPHERSSLPALILQEDLDIRVKQPTQTMSTVTVNETGIRKRPRTRINTNSPKKVKAIEDMEKISESSEQDVEGKKTQDNTNTNSNEPVANGNQLPTIVDPYSYTMLVFDNLIAPNFVAQQAPTSADFIRRCIYRQVFSEKASQEIASTACVSFGIDELTSMIIKIAAKSGIIML